MPAERDARSDLSDCELKGESERKYKKGGGGGAGSKTRGVLAGLECPPLTSTR